MEKNIALICEQSEKFELLNEYYRWKDITLDFYNDYRSLLESEMLYHIILIDDEIKKINVHQMCEGATRFSINY